MHSSPLHCTYREVYLLSNASYRYFELFVTVIILNIEGTILSDMILKHKGRNKERNRIRRNVREKKGREIKKKERERVRHRDKESVTIFST